MNFEIINDGKTLREIEDTDKVDLQTAKTNIEVKISVKMVQYNKEMDIKLQPLNVLLDKINKKLDKFK